MVLKIQFFMLLHLGTVYKYISCLKFFLTKYFHLLFVQTPCSLFNKHERFLFLISAKNEGMKVYYIKRY